VIVFALESCCRDWLRPTTSWLPSKTVYIPWPPGFPARAIRENEINKMYEYDRESQQTFMDPFNDETSTSPIIYASLTKGREMSVDLRLIIQIHTPKISGAERRMSGGEIYGSKNTHNSMRNQKLSLTIRKWTSLQPL
jgi:hypothetical protein